MKRMPKGINIGEHFTFRVGELLLTWKECNEATDEMGFLNPTGARTAMGFPIPAFQRPHVWTRAQAISFIESMWAGIPLGTYTINIDPDHDRFSAKHRNIVIDGQQRLSAIELYITDSFPVHGVFYSDLHPIDRRLFSAITFSRYETQSDDANYLREYYNLLNFGGTAHTEDEKA